jgi:hypothetical protein
MSVTFEEGKFHCCEQGNLNIPAKIHRRINLITKEVRYKKKHHLVIGCICFRFRDSFFCVWGGGHQAEGHQLPPNHSPNVSLWWVILR